MSTLSADDFQAYFESVHGVAPFRWQAELARQVVEVGWPEGIDVPTGLGKTAVIDIAVFALAAQADHPATRRTAPTRTFLVVDRRLIVDQAHHRAALLARKLLEAAPDSVVGRVAAPLRVLANGGDPLAVVRMRGGTTWTWRWLARPSQPAVVSATVDQFGSRLLFRGYGVGRFLRPIDAALCGTDSLLILDEAHLSQPLTETMRFVRQHEAKAEHAVLGSRRPQPVLLSATLPIGRSRFTLDPDAEESEIARKRLDTQRFARLVDLATRKDAVPELAAALAGLARASLSEGGIERVAVVCNTVQVARRVFELLAAEPCDHVDLALLVGRCRQHERDQLSEDWLPRLAAKDPRPVASPVIAVATQTIEVGADLDFDALITEASPLDALLQRLGRLNRLGARAMATATVVRAAARHDDDPVYGRATSRTWEWLVEQAGEPARAKSRRIEDALDRAPSVDLGPRALGTLLEDGRRAALSAEPSLAPVVLGPMLRAWARTSPSPEPDQVVAPFLHGISRPAPEVLVCWRAGLPSPTTNALAVWEDELRTAPVGAHETVSVPIWEAKRFLAGTSAAAIADIEGAPAQDEDTTEMSTGEISAVVVRSDGQVVLASQRDLRPGVTLVVPAEAGGHDQWGWSGKPSTGAAVADVADLARRRRLRLRLRPGVVGVVGHSDEARQWREDVASGARPQAGDSVLDEDDVRSILQRLPAAAERPLLPGLDELLDGLNAGKVVVTCAGEDTFHWIVVEGLARAMSEELPVLPDVLSDEDEVSTSAGLHAVTLEQHLWDVSREAERQATLLGLPGPIVAAVELAARTHDLGKADHRFQVMLNRGDRLSALARPEPLAKSGMDPTDRDAFRAARHGSGWPSGMRHESISTALVHKLAVEHQDLFSEIDVELVQHLVQTHHGRGRPLLPPVIDDRPGVVRTIVPGTGARVEVRSDDGLVDWEGPARFDRLGKRYGWWGLALLESIVRLADIAVSEAYEREKSE